LSRQFGFNAVRSVDPFGNIGARAGEECLACHKIGENGNGGPGPALTEIGARLPAQAIERTLINPTAPMPSFSTLQKDSPDKFDALVTYVSQLKGDD